jgi:hypothetical protein
MWWQVFLFKFYLILKKFNGLRIEKESKSKDLIYTNMGNLLIILNEYVFNKHIY